MINDQIVDTKVAKAMAKIEEIRNLAKNKEAEALKLGAYKTNCFYVLKDEKLKLSTLDLNKLILVGENILEKNTNLTDVYSRLGMETQAGNVLVQNYSVEDWFHDLRICVLKCEARALQNKASKLEQQAMTLESDLNKRNRAADLLLKDLDL